jgi:hypothetical protein
MDQPSGSPGPQPVHINPQILLMARENITNLIQKFRIGCMHESAEGLPNEAGAPKHYIGPGDACNYSIKPEPPGEVNNPQTQEN